MKKIIICITAGSLMTFGAVFTAMHLFRKDKAEVEYIPDNEITGI